MVQMEDDAFIDLLWDRVDSTDFGKMYPESFWKDAFEQMKDFGWFSPRYNAPMYIVDNVAVNGNIIARDEVKAEFDEIDRDYNGDIDEWVADNGYDICGDYVVLNWGL